MKWAPLVAALCVACPKPSPPDARDGAAAPVDASARDGAAAPVDTDAAAPSARRGRRSPPAPPLPPPNPACVGEPEAEVATLAPGDRVAFQHGWTLTWTAWRADEGAAHLTLHDGTTELQLTVSGPMPQLVPVLSGCWRALRVDGRALEVALKPARPDASGL